MRLKLLLSTAAAAGMLAGAALAQTADPSRSTIPPTNDPSTMTDDQCGRHGGPKPCGAQVQSVPIPESTTVVEETYVEPAPSASMTTTTEMYATPPMAPQDVRTTLVTNGPVPDTPENRARFGGPDSRAGRATAPVGNVP